ncbi:hypothetical protein [Paraflavitalea speifideaquila]|uniref:hypothetical protein n=1 Tax=Paraflavitalea speifideaquila TaxID=3076558 RepID=UPI0028E2CC6B|nr:hypothetical protein [Paraflavitalea speifideiaquila]
MVPNLRKAYNEAFTVEQFNAFLKDLKGKYPGAIEFRLAETPVFVDKSFAQKIFDACESIIDVIIDPSFKSLTERAIPAGERVPNENAHAHMIAFDFGVCEAADGTLEPQLIEMQGFPTLLVSRYIIPTS